MLKLTQNEYDNYIQLKEATPKVVQVVPVSSWAYDAQIDAGVRRFKYIIENLTNHQQAMQSSLQKVADATHIPVHMLKKRFAQAEANATVAIGDVVVRRILAA